MFDRIALEKTLNSVFNINKFRDNQWTVIEKLLQNRKILFIEKTGYGKSLCYQFPAYIFDGVTIIFSPLLSLMRDQVSKLKSLGIAADCVNSAQSAAENDHILALACQGRLKILYIAPERLENEQWAEAVRLMNISMVVIDEAHCISTWGHDFRTSYLRIIDLIKLLPHSLPILATTATATTAVQRDILNQLGNGVECIRGNLMRPNLGLNVIIAQNEDQKMTWIGENIQKLEGSGLIYCGTQIDTDIYARWLKYLGVNSTVYNGGIDSQLRKTIEQELIANKYKCVVATNALGMGLDKPDIRFIIHTQMPVSPIHYYQEIGRAGRDGKMAQLILLYNPANDLRLPRVFIESSKPAVEKYHKIIDLLLEEPLGEVGLIKKSNLRQNQVRIIENDLVAMGIIHQVRDDKTKHFEYTFGAADFDYSPIEEVKQIKHQQLEQMVNYVETTDCRMKFLCNYLGDKFDGICSVCDNDSGRKIMIKSNPKMENALFDFSHNTLVHTLKLSNRYLQLKPGIAASYFTLSPSGEAIKRSKYSNNTLPYSDELYKITLNAFNNHLRDNQYDLLLYIPSHDSTLVKDLAQRLSSEINIPISHNLLKIKRNRPQNHFTNSYLKRDNVKDAFDYADPLEITGKSILLFDDFCDSGYTLKEAAKCLFNCNINSVTPFVSAQLTPNSDAPTTI